MDSSSPPSWGRWLWFMLCSAIGLFLSMFLKWCMISVAFPVWFPQPVSERKGSAISGLTRAPNPIKKWRACTKDQSQTHETSCGFFILIFVMRDKSTNPDPFWIIQFILPEMWMFLCYYFNKKSRFYRLFHLKENSWVLLIDGHQLYVCDGVNDSHCQSGHSHGDGEHKHIIAQRDDGKYYRDDESRDK